MTNREFAEAASKFLKALAYRHRGQDFEYLRVYEWRHGVQHAHVLLRIGGRLPRRSIREARRLAGVMCSVMPVKNVVGASNYIFKHMKNPEKKAELTPETFKGKMYTVSKGFLTKPFQDLWEEIRTESEPPTSRA